MYKGGALKLNIMKTENKTHKQNLTTLALMITAGIVAGIIVSLFTYWLNS